MKMQGGQLKITQSILNTNLSNNRRSTENNRVNIAQVPEERYENLQIYSTVNL